MKQIRQLAVVISILVITGLFTTQATAQTNFERGQIGINAGFAYGFDMEEPGIRVGATYFLSENIRVGADLTYWLVDSDMDYDMGVDITFLEFNGNFHYLFLQENGLIIYGIGALGLHYADVSYDMEEWGGPSYGYSDTELGLGIGGGIEYSLGGVSIFAEPKLFLSGFDQLKFNAGVRFYL